MIVGHFEGRVKAEEDHVRISPHQSKSLSQRVVGSYLRTSAEKATRE